MLEPKHIQEFASRRLSNLPARRRYPLRLPSIALVLFVLAGALFQLRTEAAGSTATDEFVPGEVVLKLADAADLPAVAAQYGLDSTPLDQFGNRPIYRLRVKDGASVTDRVAQLQSDSEHRVVFAEPNYLVRPPEGVGIIWSGGTPTLGDGTYLNQWAVEKIKLSTAQSVARGAGVNIAVLDTGVDATHPALTGHLLPGYDFVDMDNDPSEVGEQGIGAYGHGTHITGLLALVAPEAKIIPLRVLDQNGVGNIWVLAEALEFAVNPDGDVYTNDGSQVINMSISTPRPTNLLSSTLRKITFERTDENGHTLEFVEYNNIVVAAAGNSGTDTPEYPAAESFHAMLAVGASDDSDAIAGFSTRGPWVSLLAPGERIVSTVPGGGYATWSGTSMAAPFAAGVAALLRSKLPTATNSTVISHLVATSSQIAGPVSHRLDAGAALTTAVKAYVPPPTIQFSGVPPLPDGYDPRFVYEPKFFGHERTRSIKVTVTRFGDDSIPVSVDYATSDQAGQTACDSVSGFASAQCDYTAVTGTLQFAPGEPIKEIVIPIAAEYLQEGNEIFTLTLSNPTGGKLNGKADAMLVIFDDKTLPPALDFWPAYYTTAENATSIINGVVVPQSAVITVRRTGDTAVPVSVVVRTVDDPMDAPCDPQARDANNQLYPQGRASARCDYSSTVATLNFAPGEMFKHLTIPIINDAFVEPVETFQIMLVDPTGATIAGTNPVSWAIKDDDVAGTANPIDEMNFYVRQQYLDFLGREPDSGGFEYWRNRLQNCAATPGCDMIKERKMVSAGFFYSNEFLLQKGYFMYRFYGASLGRRPTYAEFIPDLASMGQNDAEEEAKRVEFTNRWVTRADFIARYPNSLSNTEFVNKLVDTAGITLDRNQLITQLNGGTTRAQIVRQVAESQPAFDKFFKEAFISMQYFGYLRRDPDAGGYDYWFGRMPATRQEIDANPNLYIYDMVGGFVYSTEYQLRFGNRNY